MGESTQWQYSDIHFVTSFAKKVLTLHPSVPTHLALHHECFVHSMQVVLPAEEHPQQQPPLQPALRPRLHGSLGCPLLHPYQPAMQRPPLQRPALRHHALLKDALVVHDGVLDLVGQTDRQAGRQAGRQPASENTQHVSTPDTAC
jgi:hypothetical protein